MYPGPGWRSIEGFVYASVLLLNRFEKVLWYEIPGTLKEVIKVGTLVRVPLRNRHVSAMVVRVMPQLPFDYKFEIKIIISLEPLPPDNRYHQFIEKIAQFYMVSPLHFYARVNSFLNDKKCELAAVLYHAEIVDCIGDDVTLTEEQKKVVDYVGLFIKSSAYASTVLHGVTGSGKTEVYKKLITTCICEQKSAMMLLPEVSLSLQFEQILKKQMPSVKIFGFHSATMLSEKRALWQALLAQQPVLVLGVHLPVMLPISNLGLIIVDEEHEQGFVEKKHPKINSKEVALWRAHTYGLPILLGSATPSLASLYNVRQQRWKLFQIKKRFSGAFPQIQKVLLREQAGKRRKHFWVSKELEDAVNTCLGKKQQAIIYLNRRGYSFFVQCRSCGFIFECPHCSVSLTLHIDKIQTLRCHYCAFYKNLPQECPECHIDQKHFFKKGIGTQQAVQIFKEIFPSARIERADLDTTSKKRTWRHTVEQFEKGEIDILVGTQTITKGYHFPGVTLVGVLWADVNLHFPQFNASEIALQQIIQVAGRAGRCHPESLVIVQTLRDHSIFNYLNEEAYIDFCDREFLQRKEIVYPPLCRLVHIELRNVDVEQLNADAEACANYLRQLCNKDGLSVQILGPAQPIIARVQDIEMRHIFLKAFSFKELHAMLFAVKQQNCASALFIVIH